MKRRFHFLLIAGALAAGMGAAAGTDEPPARSTTEPADGEGPDSAPSLLGEWWTEAIAPSNRGAAILSPIDSPDGPEPPVGGGVKSVPYYCGYWQDCDPSAGVPDYHSPWPPKKSGAARSLSRVRETADYGSYSGARQDEAALLRLGGGASRTGAPDARHGEDLIDRIQGRR